MNLTSEDGKRVARRRTSWAGLALSGSRQQRRIQVDRVGHRDALLVIGHLRQQFLQLRVRDHLVGESLRIARRLEVGVVTDQHPVTAIARGPENRRCLVDQLQNTGVRIGLEARRRRARAGRD